MIMRRNEQEDLTKERAFDLGLKQLLKGSLTGLRRERGLL